jgi:trans-2,3-dihydro-3-hydroxyanthranilate isomerase
MKELTIKCVDTFTTRSFAGNPAGVISDADGLSHETMQKIASEMLLNIIEIAFVTSAKSGNAACRVHYFTPKTELGCSGHVTIATCYSLIEDGKIPLEGGMTRVQFETGVGNVPIEIHFRKGRLTDGIDSGIDTGMPINAGGDSCGILEKIMMHQNSQSFRPSTIPVEDIAAVLGIDPSEITRTGLPTVVATYDMDWLIIPVKHKETVLQMNPDLIKLGMLNRKHGISTNHVFTLDTFDPRCVTYARHFGPVMGLWEDPASAMASGGLGAYLLTYGVTDAASMMLEQGKEAGSLAKIRVEVERKDGKVALVRVGGLASTSITQKIRIESEEIVTV